MKKRKTTINDFDDEALEIIYQFAQCRIAHNMRVPEPWGTIANNYAITRNITE